MYQYKIDKTLLSTHQAMPVNAGKIPNVLEQAKES